MLILCKNGGGAKNIISSSFALGWPWIRLYIQTFQHNFFDVYLKSSNNPDVS